MVRVASLKHSAALLTRTVSVWVAILSGEPTMGKLLPVMPGTMLPSRVQR